MCLQFTEIIESQTSVYVKFRYPVEGISGYAKLIKKDGFWIVTESVLVEK